MLNISMLALLSQAYKNADLSIYLTAAQTERAASVAEELWYTVTPASYMQV